MNNGLQLFDFIKIVFEDPNTYKKIPNYEKSKFFFMLNRYMAITYPMQANMFNMLNVDPVAATDYWQRNMSKLFRKMPNWIYVKTAKDKTVKNNYPSEEAIKMYLNKMEMSKRDLRYAEKLYGMDVYEPMLKLDIHLKQIAKLR